MHVAEKTRIGDDDGDVALVERRHDPQDQERRRDVGPAHARRGANSCDVADHALWSGDGHGNLPCATCGFGFWSLHAAFSGRDLARRRRLVNNGSLSTTALWNEQCVARTSYSQRVLSREPFGCPPKIR